MTPLVCMSLEDCKSDCIPDTSGLWRCDIADPDDEIQSIYIYIGNDNTSG